MSDVDPVFQLQSDLHARISAGAFFSDVVVLLDEKGISKDNILDALKTQIKKTGKKGVAVVVDRPIRYVPKPEPSGPAFEIVLPCSVFEEPLSNRGTVGTGKPIEAVVSHLCHLIHGCRLNDKVGQLYCDDEAVQPVVRADGLLLSEVNFVTHLKLASPDRVQTPRILGNAAGVSFACNTPDAEIYYTLDGSYPWSGNAAAVRFGITTLIIETGETLVTENGDPLVIANPFPVTPGTLVRVAAYAENKQGSDVASANL